MNDDIIVQMLFRRDEEALVALKNTFGKYCHSIAQNITHSTEDAEECVNDTWFQIWRSIPPNKPSSLKLYAARITRNLAFNRYRDAKAGKRSPDAPLLPLEELSACVAARDSGEAAYELHEVKRIIERFLDKQTKRNREIFVIRYFYAESIEYIANQYKISQESVCTMLFRLRKKLKDELERNGYPI